MRVGRLAIGVLAWLAWVGTAAACNIEKIATLPLRLENHVVLVAVKINGTPARLALDTGSQNTLLSDDAARRLGLPRDPTHRTRVLGVTGAATVDNVRVHDFEFGELLLSDLSLAAVALPVSEEGPQADGLLGADVFADYDMELDFVAGTMSLYDVSECGRITPPWQGSYVTLPATLTPSRLLTVPAELDGAGLTALFDTGSDTVRVSNAAAARAGATSAALAHDRGGVAEGAGGYGRSMIRHRFGALVLGADTVRGPVLDVMTIGNASVDMLLGLPYMRGRRFWLSYATRAVFAQRAVP
jgi:predicted aspartyl protease